MMSDTSIHTFGHSCYMQTPDGRLVEAPNSGHMIMYTEPRLIANEIIRMIDSPMHH